MLSILIPVYNYNTKKLVNDLYAQAILLKYPFEIILLNNHSDQAYSYELEKLQKKDLIIVIHSEQLLNRSIARNTLALKAKGKFLLFIDCDASLVKPDFIKTYIENASSSLVLCGGTAYHLIPEKNSNRYLRWYYGIHREMRPAEIRNKNAWSGFSAFNFFISADIFKSILFNEKISHYGHEDTLFGFELKNRNILIKHIDNTLIHDGIEESSVFLKKTKVSLVTLKEICDYYCNDPLFIKDIRIMLSYKKLQKYGLNSIFSLLYKHFNTLMEKNLLSQKPSLILFDLYKLSYLCTLK